MGLFPLFVAAQVNIELVKNNVTLSTYTFADDQRKIGLVLKYDNQIDTFGYFAYNNLTPVDFAIDQKNGICRLFINEGSAELYFLNIVNFLKSGNRWYIDRSNPYYFISSFSYSGALPYNWEDRPIYSNYRFEDINTFTRSVSQRNKKSWTEKILLNDNYKIVKIEEN